MSISVNVRAIQSLLAISSLFVFGFISPFIPSAVAAWQPTKPITFIVTGGAGGGADQMARLIQGIVAKYKLSNEPMVVVIENGGGGGQGFMDIKNSAGDAHRISIVLSNLYSVPLSTNLPFNWRDTTPVAMMALDEFVLWVNAQSPYKTAQDYIQAAKASPGDLKMGGAGSKREDEIVTAMLEQATGTKFTFIPYKGGGEIATQLEAGISILTLTIRSSTLRIGALAEYGPFASSTVTNAIQRRKSPTRCPGTISPPASRQGSTRSISCPRYLDAKRRYR